MSGLITVIGAVLQVVLLLMNSHFSKQAATKQAHADKAKEISDAIASGNISNINAVIGSLRSK